MKMNKCVTWLTVNIPEKITGVSELNSELRISFINCTSDCQAPRYEDMPLEAISY